ncbi:hypothetical protein [Kitasatospora acidiphila]|uniref:hypothetical protein n=1 Tax=Kitasatospora acidiphila TaxID=2567942 RepID=UPI003C73A678
MTSPLPEPRKRQRHQMTMHVFDVTSTGRCIDISYTTVSPTWPYSIEIDSRWPDCRCRRCRRRKPAKRN